MYSHCSFFISSENLPEGGVLIMSKKILIIAEKPSAARAIAEALGGFQKREGYLENPKYYLSWAIGHLIELAMPEDYDPALKKWAINCLPIIPKNFQLKPVEKTEKQLRNLKELAKESSSMINACDAGREGELIFRYIVKYLEINLPIQRLWASSLTKESLLEAFKNLKDGKLYDSLYYSAKCRSEGDWLIGINCTRVCSVRFGDSFSVGRVQTPTLALLVQKQEEVDSFTSKEFWEVMASFNTGKGEYEGKWFKEEDVRFEKKEEAELIATKVFQKEGEVLEYTQKKSKEKPPLPYDLTNLQRVANRKYGFTADETLKVAQSLYEAKLITYPRTDCSYLSSDLLSKLPSIMKRLSSLNLYSEFINKADLLMLKKGHRVIQDDKISDHHAIIPTGEKSSSLNEKERKVYDLVVRRFICQFYPEAIFQDASAVTKVCEETFKSSSKKMLQPGWKEVEGMSEEKKESCYLPKLVKGQKVTCDQSWVRQGKTQPPKPYTEDTLLKDMEYVGKKIENQELKDIMKGRGLGTPATRAAIIERLKKVGYIEGKKKNLFPTLKGKELVRLLRENGVEVLFSPQLTGEWEKNIYDIQQGEFSSAKFMEEIISLTRKTTDKIKGFSSHGQEESNLKCPLCGKEVRKYPRSWSCVGYKEGCKFTIWLEICGKKLTDKQINDLIGKGKTGVLKGFKSKAGKSFDASLAVKNGKLEFQFPKAHK